MALDFRQSLSYKHLTWKLAESMERPPQKSYCILTYPPKLRLPSFLYSVNSDRRVTIVSWNCHFFPAPGMINYLASKIYHFLSCMYLSSSSCFSFSIVHSSLTCTSPLIPLFHLFSSYSSQRPREDTPPSWKQEKILMCKKNDVPVPRQ